MSPIKVLILLALLIIYLTAILIFIRKSSKEKEINILMTENRKNEFKTFGYEDNLLKKLGISSSKAKLFIYFERVILFAGIAASLIMLRGIALAAFGAIFIVIASNDSYKKEIYRSGIDNIGKVTNFINYYIPHINSGNSADQSLLGYINYSGDEELAEYYEHKDDPEFEIKPHLKQIVDIYDISKYNEEKGMKDYTYILDELAADMAQKQVYYNSFIARIGEIQPICYSYYIGVPILIGISFKQTGDFWLGGYGFIVALALLGMFALFKFLIFRLQKKTINVIF